MAGIAAKKVVALIENKPAEGVEEYTIKPHLIIRESTRKATKA